MYLKSLTVKGFKSFASATTFNFETGITAVVGPNGSGKSNVVDAIAWVMGEQGAKALRGGKMEDVIFAGTSGRAPLGRAEVCLTIDNTDNALPIDYTEVTISRTLFRSGGSEYAINGQSCRLLDIQELLSDSGIGHEMHVIVGQGRLDDVLRATPEERRGFIEEAAGVLKHRKRKEKALRKLDSMSANMVRLQDLTGELRRQLKPLGRQAEVARRAQVIQSDVRDARLRLLADDLLIVQTALAKEEADEARLRDERGALDARLESARASEAQIEAAVAVSDPAISRVNDVHLRLTALAERYVGLTNLAQERARNANEDQGEQLSIDPEQLEWQSAAAQQACDALGAEVEDLRAELASATGARGEAEDALGRANMLDQQRRSQLARRRELLATLEGDLRSARSRLDAREAEIARLGSQHQQAQERVQPLAERLAQLAQASDTVDDGALEQSIAARDAAYVMRDSVRAELGQARAAGQSCDRDRAGVAARIEALRMSLAKGGGTTSLAESGVPLLGVVADFLNVEPYWQNAIEAALRRVSDADAVAVASVPAAVAALRHLRAESGGRTSVVVADPEVGGSGADEVGRGRLDLGDFGRWAGDSVSVSARDGGESIVRVVRRLLADVVLVEDLEQAQRVVAADDRLVAVTVDGDALGRFDATGGDGTASRLRIVAAVQEAEQRLSGLELQSDQHAEQVADLERVFADAREAAQRLTDRVHEVSKEASDQNAALSLAQSQVNSAVAEADRIGTSLDLARRAHTADISAVHEAEARLAEHAGMEEESLDSQAGPVDLDELRRGLEQARTAEVDARLAVRTAEERMNSHRTRARELREAAASEREARERAAQARERRMRQGAVAARVLEVAAAATVVLQEALDESARERLAVQQERRNRDEQLTGLRAQIRELSSQIALLTADVHRDEIARAQQRLRVEALETVAMNDFGIDRDQLVLEYGPDVPVPPSARAPGDDADGPQADPEPYPFVRSEQEKRLRTAEKSMALLGRVNPLALEEFTAMEERHTFLNTQLDDLRRSRKDLLDIVADIDERVQQVFAEAFTDVADQFTEVFARLFPGGEGKLILTDAGDLLNTGIEVEARPAGKKVKRLSLLSGGERALTGIAFLVALFKARPSPFYLMDEVEAALDDVNLARLIALLEELRETSQLLIITHQKKTMEIADALYGVTMREGVSQVISQRMRELAHAQ
ncbi:MAG: chromosome segregation protein SMC [Actinomycetes bacterium]